MMDQHRERRQHQRIFFSGRDNVVVSFAWKERPTVSFTASMMDISGGGIGVTLKKEAAPEMEKGDILILKHIRNLDLFPDPGLAMEIRWVFNHKAMAHIALGCEFIAPSAAMQAQIETLMQEWTVRTRGH